MSFDEKIKLELTEEEINKRIDQIENANIDDELREFILTTLKVVIRLDELVGMKETTIKRLRKIFNKTIEKQRPLDDKPNNGKPGGRNKGQGNNGVSAYPNAEEQRHYLAEDKKKAGNECPECSKGTLYNIDPGLFIRISGSPTFRAVKHVTEKVRCSACGIIFEADFESKESGKYDASATSILAINHYLASIPFYRMEKIQKHLLTPMPRSVQWQLMEELANKVYPIWRSMIEYAREGDLIFNDDTKGKIVSLIRENFKLSKKDRKGIFTTGILSKISNVTVNLFFTGRKHSGENLSELLKDRVSDRPVQIMSDALSSNNPKDVKDYINLLCLTHGRRNFIDIEESFKQECDFIIKKIGEVFHFEKATTKLTPKERLEYHQSHSTPIMEEIYNWCQLKFEKREVEPNSSLGKGISYLIKHWEGLTGFLRYEGAPLDNNELEQKLRTPVLNRKNWLFYKNEVTALIGDIILSVLKTCELNDINPFDYLNKVQEESELAKLNPEKYTPWAIQL